MCGRARTLFVILAISAASSSCAALSSGAPRCDAQVEVEAITGLAAEDESSTIRYCFDVEEDADLVNFQIEERIRSGRVEWVLRDPLGETQESNELRGWNFAGSTRQVQATPGTWQLEVRAEDLTGGYHWSWSVSP